MEYRFDEEKFVNAVLFFAKNTDSDSFGVTKLNKLLYFSDFGHFKAYGRPIIGDTYIKMKRGPVPTTAYSIINQAFSCLEDGMVKSVLVGKISIKKKNISGRKVIHHIEALVDPDLSVFSKSELAVMKEVAEICHRNRLTASDLSEISHRLGQPWSLTSAENQPIDYELILDESENSIPKGYVAFWNKEREDFAELLSRPCYASKS
jgi:uncharacterized phage-associated protein